MHECETTDDDVNVHIKYNTTETKSPFYFICIRTSIISIRAVGRRCFKRFDNFENRNIDRWTHKRYDATPHRIHDTIIRQNNEYILERAVNRSPFNTRNRKYIRV